MKFMENTKINFMKFKSFGFGLSSVLAFGSIIILLMGVNLGIDFKGGNFTVGARKHALAPTILREILRQCFLKSHFQKSSSSRG